MRDAARGRWGRRVAGRGWAVPAALAVPLLLLATACSGGSGGPSVRQGGTLHVALESDPASLNPLVARDAVSRRAYTPLFPLLYSANADLSVGPDLAASAPSATDQGKTLTVQLRTDAKWSDGMPITADDVVFTVSTERDPTLPSHDAFDWAPLTGVTKVDQFSVKFSLAAPDAAFTANALVTPIVPRHAFTGMNPAQIAHAPFNTAPTVTGGPFSFDHRDPGKAIYLNANPGYFLGNPHIDHMVETVTGDPSTVLDQLESGKLSWVPSLTAGAAASAASAPGVTVRAFPDATLCALLFNVRAGRVFAGQPVRQALAYAVSHDSLVADATAAAQGFPVWSDINPSSWAFTQNAATQYVQSADRSRRLLQGDGWSTSAGAVARRGSATLAASVIYPRSDGSRAAAATAIATQSRSAGFNLSPAGLDDAAFARALATGAFDAAVVALPTRLDPDDAPFLATGGAANYGGYSNASVDSLIAAERSAVSRPGHDLQQERRAIFEHIEQVVSADLPMYFLWVPRAFTGWSATVAGVAGAGAQLDQDRADSFYRDWFLL